MLQRHDHRPQNEVLKNYMYVWTFFLDVTIQAFLCSLKEMKSQICIKMLRCLSHPQIKRALMWCYKEIEKAGIQNFTSIKIPYTIILVFKIPW